MKVRYIGKDTVSLCTDKVYPVIATETHWYRIFDETEDDYLFPGELFEIVDPEPDVHVPTDEEYWAIRDAELSALV